MKATRNHGTHYFNFIWFVFCTFQMFCAVGDTNNWNWWKHASFYNIYVRSFKDSNNDGVGDIPGIIQKIDHFTNAGIDAIFLSPIFESPQIDLGYDISNFTAVDPEAGTMEDLKKLIKEVHARNVKILLDFVPNHTSDQHQWFKDSVNNVEEYRDFYIWADAHYDEHGNRYPPNNWLSVFHYSAWQWNEKRQQYYLHQFLKSQPDLNFRNPKVLQAMDNVLLFWLDMGIDGFRVDAMPHIFKNEHLYNEPPSHSPEALSHEFESLNHIHTKDQKENYELLHHWRNLIDNYTKSKGGDARILMTEVYSSLESVLSYFGNPDGTRLGAHFTFNFFLMGDTQYNSSAHDFVICINKWLYAIPPIYTSSWVLSNHDHNRSATRYGPGNVDGFNMLKAILPGIDVTYNGEEIGQENGDVRYEETKDFKVTSIEYFEKLSRDFCRTPFHWDDSVNAGFNDGAKPWLPVSKKYLENNLKKQIECDGLSHFKIFQFLTALRRDPILVLGEVKVRAASDWVIVIRRSYKSKSIVLVFNKGEWEAVVNVAEDVGQNNRLEMKSVDSKKPMGLPIDPHNLMLDPHEALIIKCKTG